MRLLLLGLLVSLGAIVLGWNLLDPGTRRDDASILQPESLAGLEPIVGERLDALVATPGSVAGNQAQGASRATDGGGLGLSYGDDDWDTLDSGSAGAPRHERFAAEQGELPEDVLWIDFDALAVPDYRAGPHAAGSTRPTDEEIFPAKVLGMDGQRIALDGFMDPIEFVPGTREVAAFLFAPFLPGCHFGDYPRVDEFVDATISGKRGVKFSGYQPVRAIGTLRVGELVDDSGYVMSLYRLEVENVELLW